MQSKTMAASDPTGAVETRSPQPASQAATPTPFSRRALFQRAAAIGSVVLLAPVLLTACGGNEAPAATTGETTATNAGAQTTCVTAGTGDPGIRKALAYVDKSSNPDKDCANCRFFKEAASGEVCGGCEIIKGKIAATGYCNSWVARPA